MAHPTLNRLWHRRKRTWAIAAVWLLVAYVLSTGPMQYAAVRGWVPAEVFYVYCWPAMRGLNNRVGFVTGYWDWVIWWDGLARTQSG